MRDKWTDERLDDLNHRVDEGFAEMRTEFRAIRGEMASRFDSVDPKFDSIDAKFAAQNRMMIQLFSGMIVAMTIGFLGIIATVISQT